MSKQDVAQRLMERLAAHLASEGRGMIALRIMRLANGKDLPLPAYESPGAAGMDLRAAEDAHPEARGALSDADWLCHRTSRSP